VHESVAADLTTYALTVGSTLVILTVANTSPWTRWLIPAESASGSKAGAWRDPYHQTRALLAVSNLATSEPAEHGGAARQ